ncbi:MAG: hypothetical protein ACP5RZ_00945 [Thermoplasmata archaeon]
MANKKPKSNKARKEEEEEEVSEEEEYLEFLEGLLAEFTLAFLKDMNRHGIFDEKEENEYEIKDEFVDKILEVTMKNLKDSDEIEDVVTDSIIEVLEDYYGDENLSEEEIFPRAEIILSYVIEDIEDQLSKKK